MSRAYEMTVVVEDVPVTLIKVVSEAMAKEWNFDDIVPYDVDPPGGTMRNLRGNGQDQLCGGDTDEDFTDRIAHAIWVAAKQYLAVSVDSTCLEDIPCDSYYRDEDDYDVFIEEQDNAALALPLPAAPVEKTELTAADEEVIAAELADKTVEVDDCSTCGGHVLPGLIFPIAINGNDMHPWVECCDTCQLFTDDEKAAEFVALFFGLKDKLRNGIHTDTYSRKPFLDIPWHEAVALMRKPKKARK